MASYQAPNYIQNFSSYIPEINPDQYEKTQQTYVQGGLQKQAQYDANYQKIQGMIDTIGGLQVSREVDKNLLNQKMGELSTRLKDTVGRDLSITSVVQQAGGLAAQVYNDRDIQNAVASTINERDALAQVQQAHKEGKNSPTNDYAVMRSVNQWRQDPNAGAQLGKQQYTNFFDYNKGFQDFMKDKHGTVRISQDPATLGPDGKPSWSAYALREGKEVRLDPMDVAADAQTYFASNAQAKGQLDIDSMYYVDSTPNEYALEAFRANNAENISNIDAQISAMNKEKTLYPEKSIELQSRIDAYTSQKLNLEARYRQQENEFIQNPSGAKAKLYQQNIVSGFANRFAYTDLESKIIKNPIFDAQMDEQNLRLKQQKFAWEQETWREDFNQEERKMANTIKAAEIASGYIAGGQYDAAFAENYGPEQYKDDVKAEWQSVSQDQAKLLYDLGYTDVITIGEDSQGNPKYRLAPGASHQQREDLWTKVAKSYTDNPQGADPFVRNYFGNTNSAAAGIGRERAVFAEMKRINQVEDKIANQFKNTPEYQRYQESLAKIGNSSETLLTEGNTAITRGDLTRFAEADIPVVYNLEEAMSRTGLPEDKVKLLYQYVRGDTGNFTKDVISAVPNALARAAGGNSPAAKLRKEYQQISSVVKNDMFKEMRSARKKAFDNIIPNVSQLSVAEQIGEKNSNKQAVLTAFAMNQPDKVEEFASVTGDKGAGKITLGGIKSPVTGGVTAFISNANGKTAKIEINDQLASQLFPTLMSSDPNSSIQRVLDSNRPQKGAASSTGPNGPFSYTPRTTNMTMVNLRYQIKDDGRGNYTPDAEFKIKGSDSWKKIPVSIPVFGSIEQANSYMDKLAAYDDNYFYNTFLK